MISSTRASMFMCMFISPRPLPAAAKLDGDACPKRSAAPRCAVAQSSSHLGRVFQDLVRLVTVERATGSSREAASMQDVHQHPLLIHQRQRCGWLPRSPASPHKSAGLDVVITLLVLYLPTDRSAVTALLQSHNGCIYSAHSHRILDVGQSANMIAPVGRGACMHRIRQSNCNSVNRALAKPTNVLQCGSGLCRGQ